MEKGKFITLEGIDGAGKSTHLEWIAEWLRARGKPVLVTREPGGTALGERLRQLLLGEPMHRDTEVLLLFAARQEHLYAVILPALDAGRWVVCDRFTDATVAYQGGGRGVPMDRVAVLEHWVQGDFQPHLTFLFDLPVAVALERLRGGRVADRFEVQGADFFDRVRATYLRRAAEFPFRTRVISAGRSPADVRKELEEQLSTICIT